MDLDCTEAVALASAFLPPTESVFGRAGKRKPRNARASVMNSALGSAVAGGAPLLPVIGCRSTQRIRPPIAVFVVTGV
jgi:hypothetical protein